MAERTPEQIEATARRFFDVFGRIIQMPQKQKAKLELLDWLILQFQPDAAYSELQVNLILSEYHDDTAYLRRSLVEFGYLDRNPATGTYWVIK